jgi:hypothetical protein
MMITRGVKNGTWGSYRMMIIRGENERYLESLQDDDHPVRTPGTILLLHE